MWSGTGLLRVIENLGVGRILRGQKITSLSSSSEFESCYKNKYRNRQMEMKILALEMSAGVMFTAGMCGHCLIYQYPKRNLSI